MHVIFSLDDRFEYNIAAVVISAGIILHKLNICSQSGEMHGYRYLNEHHFKKKKNEQFPYRRKHGLYFKLTLLLHNVNDQL